RSFILQEDGTRCRTGAYARWWKETHQIGGFEYWPAQSPDLNSFFISALECKLKNVRASINNANSLRDTIKEEWDKMSLELADRLVSSMKDRCQSVIDARDSPTKY
ncbi:hypothetical protein EDC94DRAFT_512093, partial [Helicostylum pulchrum]